MRSFISVTCVLGLLCLTGCSKDKEVVEQKDKAEARAAMAKDRLDLAYLPDGYMFAASLRPDRILDSVAKDPAERAAMVEEFTKSIKGNAGIPVGIPYFESLQQVVVAVDANVLQQAMNMGFGSDTKREFPDGDFPTEKFESGEFENGSKIEDDGNFKESDSEFEDSTPGFDGVPEDRESSYEIEPSPFEEGTYFISAAAKDDDLQKLVDAAKTERKSTPGAPDEMPGVMAILRYSKPIDAQAFAKALMQDGPPVEPEKHMVDGKPFYTLMPMLGFLVLDDRTFLFTLVEGLPAIVNADPGSSDPLKTELRSLQGDSDFHASLVMPADLRKQVTDLAGPLGEQVPDNMQGLTKLPQSLTAASLQLSLSGDTLARLSIKANDKSVVDELETSAREALKLAKPLLMMASSGQPSSKVQTEMTSLANKLLNGIKIETKQGNQFTIEVAKPANLSETIAVLVSEAKKEAQVVERRNDLKQVGLAFHNYHDTFAMLPPGQNKSWYDAKTGQPHLSWRVHILPHIEQSNLYDRFHLDEPWDSEHNTRLLDEMPDIYRTSDDATKTSILMIVGEGTAYEGKQGLRFRDFLDGLSNTILVVRAGAEKAVPWTKPEDLPFQPDNPIAAFGKADGDGFQALRADGGVLKIPTDIPTEKLRAWLTRNGEEPILD